VKKDTRFSLTFKFSVAIMLASMLLGVLLLLASYQLYTKQTTDRYARQGEILINTVSTTINWDKVDSYSQTLKTDDAYWATLEAMRRCALANGAEHLFVMKPQGDDAVFVFDTDGTASRYSLGASLGLHEGFGPAADDLQEAESTGSIVTNDRFGWPLSIYVPFTNSQGQFVAYLGVDYDAQHIIDEMWSFIGVLVVEAFAVSVVMTVLFLLILRSLMLKPINAIASAANSYLVGQDAERASSSLIAQLDINTHDQLQSLAESLKAMEKKIQNYVRNVEVATFRAETDSMTTLYNREAFEKRVSESLAAGGFDGYFVFMMIDLDSFKAINDTWGHSVGDEAITACGEAIRSNFRSSDLIARIGGDEFAVFYKSPTVRKDVEARAQSICGAVRGIVVAEGVRLTVSIGVAIVAGTSAHDYQGLYVMADNALYGLKASGRDGFRIEQAPDTDVG